MTNTSPGKFKQLRTEYHWHLCTKVLGSRGEHRGINVADTSSKSSRMLARLMVEKMGLGLCQKPPVDQTTVSLFVQYTTEYIQNAFSLLNHLRPGKWLYTDTAANGIASFDQHQYLMDLKKVLDENPKVKVALGGNYLISPDIIISRNPVTDDEINESQKLIGNIDEQIVRLSPFRAANQTGEAVHILHAIICCKWTMRSDRAQNTRTEALNLIRNRKGPTPRIVAVTLEPLPTRLASIAMGTGDIDCTYHGALHELVEAAEESDLEDQVDMLRTLVEGRRLRDISDLPLDLAI